MPLPNESLEPRPCPRCGVEITPRPIIYGLQTPETYLAALKAYGGSFRLGGCFIGDESPDFECPSCGAALPWVAEWRQRRDAERLARARR